LKTTCHRRKRHSPGAESCVAAQNEIFEMYSVLTEKKRRRKKI
jgi:hypothetical protein